MKKITLLSYLVLILGIANAQKFASIGDYGVDNQNEADVAALVDAWNPDFIITLGDNNYPDGEATSIDANIGKYYSNYIYPYQGSYGAGAASNKFFPVAGNHDYHATGAIPYYDYFELPGNERYYDFVEGEIHFFGINSNSAEPDGRTANSTQGQWLETQLATSTSKWNIVFFHHVPYSSGNHGSNPTLQWPFADWGATAVLAGHDHHYERLEVDGIPYFVNGTGGRNLYNIGTPIPESQVIQKSYGAMLIQASADTINFQFWAVGDILVDSYTLNSDNEITIKKSILDGSDDVEENETSGVVYMTSSDIELGYDSYNSQNFQTIGLRYKNLDIPQGVTILNAYLEFTVDENDTGTCNIEINGEKAENSLAFSPTSYNVSNRTKTDATVNWSPADWITIAAKKNSPSLNQIIQEIVDQENWLPGNSMSMIIKGSLGTRHAESFENNTGLSPKLIITYELTILPIDIIKFEVNAIAGGKEVQIDWQTSTEINNDYFTIERSTDGVTWNSLKEIDGQGNSSSITSYRYIDKKPFSGLSYYRLKQTDFNRIFDYSKVQSISLRQNYDMQIYPNPAEAYIFISNIDTEMEHHELMILDIFGKVVNSSVKINRFNKTTFQIGLSELPNGVYFIKTPNAINKFLK